MNNTNIVSREEEIIVESKKTIYMLMRLAAKLERYTEQVEEELAKRISETGEDGPECTDRGDTFTT